MPQRRQASVISTVTFGIGTQTDKALFATSSMSRLGPGVVTATSNGRQLTQSFLDSGSGSYAFINTGLAPCTARDLIAYRCPVAPMTMCRS